MEVNLKDWFGWWETFCIEYGFGDDDGTGLTVFSEEQKQRVCNMDETKFSTDGHNSRIGGRPANSVTLSDTTRSGTVTNKSSLSITLMCGSNAASHCLCMLCFPLTPKRIIVQLITAGSPISLVSKASLAMKMGMNTPLS
jgi:hypothetical protein